MTTRPAVLVVLTATLLAPLATGCGGVTSKKYSCAPATWTARSGHQRVGLDGCSGTLGFNPSDHSPQIVVAPGAQVSVTKPDGAPQPGFVVTPSTVATARRKGSRFIVTAVRDGVATVTAPGRTCGIVSGPPRCTVFEVVVRG